MYRRWREGRGGDYQPSMADWLWMREELDSVSNARMV